jgi:tripartite-type tricarboxylate transporter receptor subunit TctC
MAEKITRTESDALAAFAQSRRAFAAGATAFAAAALFTLGPRGAAANDYPTKSIRLIVPYAPGGGIDVAARIFQQKLSDILGQQIVVDNRPGASGALGAQLVAKADPDGYTLLFCAGDFITIPQFMPQLTFNPRKELLPIAMITDSPMILVASGDAPFSDTKGFLDTARASPNGMTYAMPGQGTINNVVGQWIAVSAHIKMLPIAYRSGPAAAEGIAAGEVQLGVLQPPAVYPGLVEAGKIKVIALTGTQRPDFLPPWPTFADYGLPINATLWLGIFAPLETPEPIVARLDQAIAQFAQDLGVRKRMNDTGLYLRHIGSAGFAERIRSEAARYDAIIREAGMSSEQ